MEPIGLPIIDVVNKHMIASDVYSMVSSRLKHCLKAPLDLLMHGANSSGMYRHGVKGGLGTSSEASFSATRSSRTSNNAAITPEDGLVADNSSINDLKLYYDVGSDCESGQGSNRNSFEIPTVPAIRPIEMEEAVAKDISPHGFVLRYVRPDGVSCCKCPWIHGCQGCLLPDSSNVIIDIDDGTVLAADWHYVVYHELIESAGVSRRDIIHPSMENNRIERNVPKIALSSCFDKFMEEEKLDGIVCPKCHNDSRLSKNFILWRLPPVLFVQLKRFQYDKYSRRKLNDLVEFPVENLDLSPYLAAGSPHLFQDDNKMTKNAEDLRNCCCSSGEDLKQGHMCSKYSLYAVVHHVGIMGGGHYVASVRDNSASMEALHINVAAAEALKQGQAADIEAGTSPLQLEPSFGAATPLSKQWWCYNDSTVTPIKEEDVISPSAYLLFYMRNDVARGAHKLEDIFKYAESVDEDILNGQGGSDEDVDIERNCCEEVGQQTSTAKYNISDDVSTHRNRNAANSPTFTRGSEEDPLSPGMVARRNAGGKSSVTAAKRGGYTEEEFEKIMQTNADSSTPQCHVS